MQRKASIRSYMPFVGALGPLTDDDRLVFLHFEKTAGTTVANILRALFDPAVFFPERSGGVRYWPSAALERYRLFVLHASLSDISSIPSPIKTITFLRDPIDRLISLYRYWTSFTDSAIEAGNLTLPRYAKSLSFSDFLSRKSVSIIPSIWNVYTQNLAGDQIFSPKGRPWKSESALIDAALCNLEHFAFVGIVEDMPSSLEAMHQTLSIGQYSGDVRDNVTMNLHMSDPHTYNLPLDVVINDEACERLHEVTKLDRIIYDTALRWKATPMPPRAFTLRRGSGGRLVNSGIEDWVTSVCSNGTLLYGPYATLAAGQYRVSFTVKPPAVALAGSLLLEVVTNKGATVRNRRTCHVRPSPDPLTLAIDFRLDRPAGDIEFKVYSRDGGEVMVKSEVIVERL